jgi:hypothetical protein
VSDGDPIKLNALDVFRGFALHWWKRHTMKEFLSWFAKNYPPSLRHLREYSKDKEVGFDCKEVCQLYMVGLGCWLLPNVLEVAKGIQGHYPRWS